MTRKRGSRFSFRLGGRGKVPEAETTAPSAVVSVDEDGGVESERGQTGTDLGRVLRDSEQASGGSPALSAAVGSNRSVELAAAEEKREKQGGRDREKDEVQDDEDDDDGDDGRGSGGGGEEEVVEESHEVGQQDFDRRARVKFELLCAASSEADMLDWASAIKAVIEGARALHHVSHISDSAPNLQQLENAAGAGGDGSSEQPHLSASGGGVVGSNGQRDVSGGGDPTSARGGAGESEGYVPFCELAPMRSRPLTQPSRGRGIKARFFGSRGSSSGGQDGQPCAE